MIRAFFSEEMYSIVCCFYALMLTCITAHGDLLRVARSVKPRQCVDKFEVFKNHTMCRGDRSQALNTTERNEIEHKLNEIRNSVQPNATNMMELGYAQLLEREAQTWADTCSLDHDEPYNRFMPGRYHVGQNIYVAQEMSWSDVIDIWLKEQTNFHYNQTGNDQATVGNYTQIVNADTLLVGCGKKQCGGDIFYVCNFGPSILDSQINTPYESKAVGQACHGHISNKTQTGTQTPLYPNLCSCTGKICINGGTLNMTTCECQCIPGVQTFDEHICELNCTDGGDHVDCGSMSEADCKTDLMAPFKCPWLCRVCPYSGKHYKMGSVTMPWETTTTSPPPSTTTMKGATRAATTASVTTASPPKAGTSATGASKLLMAVYVLGTIGLLM